MFENKSFIVLSAILAMKPLRASVLIVKREARYTVEAMIGLFVLFVVCDMRC